MPGIDTKAGALHVFRTPIVGQGVRTLFRALGSLPGVIFSVPFSGVFGASDRNRPGKGALRAEDDGKSLSWRAPGSSAFGSGVRVIADSDVMLEDGEDPGKFIQVRIKTVYLRPAPNEIRVDLQKPRTNVELVDITAAQAAAGGVFTLDYTAENRSGGVIRGTKMWIGQQAPYLSLSVDGGGSYLTPHSEAEAMLLPVSDGSPPGFLRPAAANFAAFKLRRTIPAGTKADPRVLGLLHFSFDGV